MCAEKGTVIINITLPAMPQMQHFPKESTAWHTEQFESDMARWEKVSMAAIEAMKEMLRKI